MAQTNTVSDAWLTPTLIRAREPWRLRDFSGVSEATKISSRETDRHHRICPRKNRINYSNFILSLGVLQDGDVGVGVIPGRPEVLMGSDDNPAPISGSEHRGRRGRLDEHRRWWKGRAKYRRRYRGNPREMRRATSASAEACRLKSHLSRVGDKSRPSQPLRD